MKITHYLIGIFTVSLFFGILLPMQAQEDTSPTLKLGLYADTTSQRVVDLRAGGILRGFKGEPSNAVRLRAANSKKLNFQRDYYTLTGYGNYYYIGDEDWSSNIRHHHAKNDYLLHGTYRIAGKRLIFSIPAEPPLKPYGEEHPFDGWEGRTLVFTIIDGETFADNEGNSWIRLSD